MSNKTIAYSLLCSFILCYFLFQTPYSISCFKLLDIIHSNYSWQYYSFEWGHHYWL